MLGVSLVTTGAIVTEPNWATPAWKDFAAHIVAGEATPYMASKMLVICTMINDVEKGWHPWALRNRWFGYRYPSKEDHLSVELAFSGGCEEVPNYIYLGNKSDYELWKTLGYVGKDYTADIYRFDHWTMVGIKRKDIVAELNKLKGDYWIK